MVTPIVKLDVERLSMEYSRMHSEVLRAKESYQEEKKPVKKRKT